MKTESKKKRSREYLEAALDAAKKILPGWMYAELHQAAFPSSGGRATSNRRTERMSAMEKMFVHKARTSELTSAELGSTLSKLDRAFAAAKRQGKSTDDIRNKAKDIAHEMEARGLKPKGDVAKDLDEIVAKGFINGEPEGGMHAHGLDRRNKKTFSDGNHLHLFIVPGTGTQLVTQEDGEHTHLIADSGVTDVSGRHSHRVTMPDGRCMETMLDGDHMHELMVETSGFGGLHKHVLKLADGTEITSISPQEFAEQISLNGPAMSGPILSARDISMALHNARALEDAAFQEHPEVNELVGVAAAGEELPELPMFDAEVIECQEKTARIAFDGGDEYLVTHELDLEPGDIVKARDGAILDYSDATVPMGEYEAGALGDYIEAVRKQTQVIPFHGASDAPLLFIASSPSAIEVARLGALVGPDGELFAQEYLKPLGLKKSDVAVGFAVPVGLEHPTDDDIEMWRDHLLKEVAKFGKARVVALGKVAKKALGPLVAYSLPHPAALRRHGNSGEVQRKIKAIAKALDVPPRSVEDRNSRTKGRPSKGQPGATLADAISELRKDGTIRTRIVKAVEEKQIVYSVVLDPYTVDLQEDWIPPAEIESTAHDFLEKSRIIGLRHSGRADAALVESWVELYPTQKDREDALQNLPHRVFRRPFGNDVLHSGAWVAGIKLSDKLWAEHKKGELDAVSIGGFSFKTKVTTEAMPDVEFLELTPGEPELVDQSHVNA